MIGAIGYNLWAARRSEYSSAEAIVPFALASPAFDQGGAIPRQYTCDGADQSPPLSWSGVPDGTKSVALIVEDPDAPGRTFTHWVLYNIPPEPTVLGAGIAKTAILPNGARHGRNDFRRGGYGGPCPTRGSEHRYVFRMFALDAFLNVTPGGAPSEVRAATNGHLLAEAELIGTYGR
ncbi:MAG TPA: YbhB/YbcL family Raf kinase inhibitor-like protein [Chloroflexota bacterium]|nr:YbhB/YbcL family Raf kinase inhibitor-like protein [Chloroflexota bacterium]